MIFDYYILTFTSNNLFFTILIQMNVRFIFRIKLLLCTNYLTKICSLYGRQKEKKNRMKNLYVVALAQRSNFVPSPMYIIRPR